MNRETKKLVVETVYQCVSKKYPFLKENEKFDIVKRIITTEGFGSLFSKKPQFANNGEYAAASLKAGVDLRTGKPLDGMMQVKFNAFANNPKYARWRSQPFSSSSVAAHPGSAAVDNMSKRQVFSAFGFSENSFPLKEGFDSVESIKSACKSGLNKLSKNMKKLGINPSRDNTIINLVKSAKTDEEAKVAIDKLIKEKMYFKDPDANTKIGPSEAGWITFSLNRQAGRGILASFILAVCVLTRMFVFSVIRQNKLSRLNKYIRKTAKHPVLFTLGVFTSWLVGFILVQLFAGSALYHMMQFISQGNENATLGIFGVGVTVSWALSLMSIIWFVLNLILVFLTIKRNNTDKDLVLA